MSQTDINFADPTKHSKFNMHLFYHRNDKCLNGTKDPHENNCINNCTCSLIQERKIHQNLKYYYSSQKHYSINERICLANPANQYTKNIKILEVKQNKRLLKNWVYKRNNLRIQLMSYQFYCNIRS